MKLYKFIFHLLIFILSFSITEANEIDSISTNEGVNKFINKQFGEKYRQFIVADTNFIWYDYSINNPYKLIADTLGMKFWYKADFNSDSRTDLLAFGSYISGRDNYAYKFMCVLAIIDSDSGKYQSIQIFSKLGQPFPIIVENDSESLILMYQTVEDNFQYRDDPRYNYLGVDDEEVLLASIHNKPYVCVDILVYKFGTFIEYNSNPKPKRIRDIYFENDCGMISCYVNNLTINSERNATLLGGEYYENKIKYIVLIKAEQFKEIIELISYLNFDKLADGYSTGSTDDSSVKLKIRYDNNLKEINDYGENGTLGLRRLYEILYDLRFNQNWKRK